MSKPFLTETFKFLANDRAEENMFSHTLFVQNLPKDEGRLHVHMCFTDLSSFGTDFQSF